MSSILCVLCGIPFFGTQDRLLASLKTADFQTGEYIVKQGDIGNKFYIIQTGEVVVVEEEALVPGKKPRGKLLTLYEGLHFGEFW